MAQQKGTLDSPEAQGSTVGEETAAHPPASTWWCVTVQSADRRYPGPMNLYYQNEQTALTRIRDGEYMGQPVLHLYRGTVVWEEKQWQYDD